MCLLSTNQSMSTKNLIPLIRYLPKTGFSYTLSRPFHPLQINPCKTITSVIETNLFHWLCRRSQSVEGNIYCGVVHADSISEWSSDFERWVIFWLFGLHNVPALLTGPDNAWRKTYMASNNQIIQPILFCFPKIHARIIGLSIRSHLELYHLTPVWL